MESVITNGNLALNNNCNNNPLFYTGAPIFRGNDPWLNILDIVDNYTRRYAILDENAVLAIIQLYLQLYGWNNIVKNIIFYDNNTKFLAYYNPYTRILFFDLERIRQVGPCMNIHQHVNMANQQILVNIFHELMHVYQLSVKRKKVGIIDSIQDFTYKIQNESSELYDREHDYFPIEREANVYAHESCIWLYQKLDCQIVNFDSLQSLYRVFMDRLVHGYNPDEFVSNPLMRIMLASTKHSGLLKYIEYLVANKLIDFNKIDLYQRLTFGFPISDEEYSHIASLRDFIYENPQGYDLNIKKLILRR